MSDSPVPILRILFWQNASYSSLCCSVAPESESNKRNAPVKWPGQTKMADFLFSPSQTILIILSIIPSNTFLTFQRRSQTMSLLRHSLSSSELQFIAVDFGKRHQPPMWPWVHLPGVLFKWLTWRCWNRHTRFPPCPSRSSWPDDTEANSLGHFHDSNRDVLILT